MILPPLPVFAVVATPLAVVTAAACHLAPSPHAVRRWLAAALRWLRRPLLIASRHPGRHCDKLHMTPAPECRPAQEPRPGDPPPIVADCGAVRAGATESPAPGAAPGQAQDAAPSSPVEDDAAPLPQSPNPPFPGGLGQPTIASRPGPPASGPGRQLTAAMVADLATLWPRDGADPYGAPVAAVTRDWQYWADITEQPHAGHIASGGRCIPRDDGVIAIGRGGVRAVPIAALIMTAGQPRTPTEPVAVIASGQPQPWRRQWVKAADSDAMRDLVAGIRAL